MTQVRRKGNKIDNYLSFKFKNSSSVIKRHEILIFPLALMVVSIIFWFGKSQLIAYIDDQLPMSYFNETLNYLYSWNQIDGLGSINTTNLSLVPFYFFASLMKTLHIQSSITQRLLYISIGLFGTVGMYVFVYSNGFRDREASKIAASASALFYFFNPVFLELYWYLNFPGAGFVFAFLPWVLYFFLISIKEENDWKLRRRAILFTILFITLTSISNVPYVFSVYLLVATIFISTIIVYRTRIKHITYQFLKILVGSILLNSWWLFPELFTTNYAVVSSGYTASQNSINFTINSSFATIFNVFSLRYFPLFNSFASWRVEYLNMVLFSVFIPIAMIIIFSSGLLLPLLKKRNSYWLHPFVLLSFPIILILIMGINKENPFAFLLSFVFTKFFWTEAILRGPYLSFGPSLAFITAILFGGFVGFIWSYLSRSNDVAVLRRQIIAIPLKNRGHIWRSIKSRKIAVYIVLIMLLILPLLYDFPELNGQNISELNYPARATLPNSLTELSSFLKENAYTNLTIFLPSASGVTYQKGGNFTYFGPTNLLGLESGTPVLEDYSPPLGIANSVEYNIIGNLPSFGTSLNYTNPLRSIGTKYIVLDCYSQSSSFSSAFNFSQIEKTIANQPYIKSVGRFGQFKLYSINSSNQIISDATHTVASGNSYCMNYPFSSRYAYSSLINESAKDLWESDLSISNISNSSFEVYGNISSTNSVGSYPGWPEVTNLDPLNISIGAYPILQIKVVANNDFVPQFGFSSLKNVVIYPNNYTKTIAEFRGACLLNVSETNNLTRTYTFYLGTSSLFGPNSNGKINHILIELQPQNGYHGSVEGKLSVEFGIPLILTNRFNPANTVILPNKISNEYRQQLTNLSAMKIAFKEINPTRYSAVMLSQSSCGYGLITFAQTYSSLWNLSSKQATVISHFEVNGIINGWLVHFNSNFTRFDITFGLQGITYISESISAIFLLLTFGLIMLSALNDWRKRIKRINLL